MKTVEEQLQDVEQKLKYEKSRRMFERYKPFVSIFSATIMLQLQLASAERKVRSIRTYASIVNKVWMDY